MATQFKVLVIGGGMYVIGRGTEAYGTIMPALLEAARDGLIFEIVVATTNIDSAGETRDRCLLLGDKMAVKIPVKAYPMADISAQPYLEAIEKEEPDIAVIAVPDHLHAEVTVNVINKGIHVLVVKPMAPSFEEATAMQQAALANNVIAEVEFHKRLDESNLLLRDAVQTKQIGVPQYAVIEYSQQKRVPRDFFSAWSAKSNIFQYLGVHYVDLLQFATGYVPRKVTAWGQKDYLEEIGIDTWDSMQVVIEWQRDDGKPFVSTHISNWIDPDETSAISDQKINIVGTQGRYQADQKHRGIQLVTDNIGVKDVNPYFTSQYPDSSTGKLTYDGYGIKSIIQFVNDVANVIDGKVELTELNKSRPSFDTCIVSSAIIEAAKESVEGGSVTITLPDF